MHDAACSMSSSATAMSSTGLATSPGTAVLPTCSTRTAQGGSASRIARFSCSNSRGHRGSYATSITGVALRSGNSPGSCGRPSASITAGTLPTRAEGHLPPEQGASDDEFLDLGRAATDRQEFRVAHRAFDGELLDVSVAAEQLYRLVRVLHRRFGDEVLRDRCLLHVRAIVLL